MGENKIAKLERRPNQSVIKVLEDTLERARAGDIEEIVIVANLTGEGAFLRYSDFNDAWRILGALEYGKDSILKALSQAALPVD